MPFRRRLGIIGTVAFGAVIAYGTARYYSTSVIAYVVEHALLQKLPTRSDPDLVRERFQRLLSSLPDRQARLEKLLNMSQYLEKLQELSPQEMDELLGKDADPADRTGL